MNDLIFFNNQGDSLNFAYDPIKDSYDSTLFFDPNSSDTFKTIGLYTLQKVNSFQFTSVDNDLNLMKFQLFDEDRFTFTGNTYFTQSITNYTSVNNNNLFYSKWIYGDNFEKKFPLGSSIVFNNTLFDISNLNNTFVVVGTKKGAIMVLTNTDNKTFTNSYSSLTFSNVSISGLNSIGIYDYKRGYIEQLSSWNEPNFYTKLYDGKKLTVISGKNNYLVTAANTGLFDRSYFKYNINSLSYTASSDLNVVITLNTDLPTIYTGGINISSNNVYFSNPVPQLLFPATEFVINDSILNTSPITVANISTFLGNINTIYYATASQVIWNNLIYQSVVGYTQVPTSSVTPDNSSYWTSSITYVPSLFPLTDESLLNTTIHLTTNKLLFSQMFTGSNAITMAKFAQNYAIDFSLFDINLYYDNNSISLNADLDYATKYANIDYLLGTQSITNTQRIIEKLIPTKEILTNSVDTKVSSNFKYSIVIETIDQFGLIVMINDHIYQEAVEYVYVGLNVDNRKTIDRTLRNLLYNNYARLTSLGIELLLESNIYTAEFDFYKDTMTFITQYPNIPLKISIEMGTFANYYVKNTSLIFNDVGSYLNININNKDYGQKINSTTSSVFIPDINTALTSWVNSYYNVLYGYGIYVSNIRNELYFDTAQTTTYFTYSVRTNKLPTPGISQYQTNNYTSGYFGTLIAGNEVILAATSSQNFEISGFSTGMITSINNSVYPYDNQEYNILYVDTNQLGLSYQGPFWGTLIDTTNSSAFSTLAFSPLAYAVGTASGATLSVYGYNSLGVGIESVLTNDYTTTTLPVDSILNDILYVNEFRKIYVVGNNITSIDPIGFEIINGITSSYYPFNKIVYNSFNKYLYVISNNNILIIDPITDKIIYTITYGTILKDININPINGDVYISTNNTIQIFYYNSFVSSDVTISITGANKIEYNIVDANFYITGTGNVYEINGITRTIESSYVVASLQTNYIYSEPIYGSVYVWGTTLHKITDGVVDNITAITNGFFTSDILYDNFTGNMLISYENYPISIYSMMDYNDNVIFSSTMSYIYNGLDMVVNQFDGDVYMTTYNGDILVIDNVGAIQYTQTIGFVADKIIYDPLRYSVIAMGASGSLFEMKVNLNAIITISPSASTPSSLSDNLYGTLDPNYVPYECIWLSTRQYVRYPRENYSNQNIAQYVWKFVDDTHPNIFMYDFSGSQLPTGTSYSYTGILPLSDPYLNRTPNTDLNKVSDPTAQQTIFDEIVYDLEYLDSTTDLSLLPTPMQLFLGYNSPNEGWENSVLKLYKREFVNFSITYNPSNNNLITISDFTTYGIIQLNKMSSDSFITDSNDVNRGFKVGQIFQLFVSDVTNKTNKYISYNNGKIFQVQEVFNTQLVVNYLPDVMTGATASLIVESNLIGVNTYLQFTFVVLDKEMASINLFGQTEIEDVRFKIQLNNVGHNIDPTDAYIFKKYDVNEGGVDWSFLNKKRKEMLMVQHQIFSYVGSYKAIINSINYFGYNDLILSEYYRNINPNSPDYNKLFKVEISDIFNNSVAGWNINDYLAVTMPNPNYTDTNLFNLTYLITDKQGNNVLMYSLQEVVVKLQGLKKWLEKNVIPITNKILDITGRADFVDTTYIKHKLYGIKSFQYNDSMTPINFDINNAYLMPINSGSTVYNLVLDFKASKIGTLPLEFDVCIRTYKTYLEWNPFTIYNVGDNITYYGIIYQSAISNNYLNDPRIYASVSTWDSNTEYFDGQYTNYNRHIYEYLGTQSTFVVFGTSSVPTPAQVIYNGTPSNTWLDISQWVVQDLVPVQTIYEHRSIGSITYSNVISNVLFYTQSVVQPDYLIPSQPFNFSVDSNIDPFITVRVDSNNGYGCNFGISKNYQIRGTNDLFVSVAPKDSIGPITILNPITNTL